MRRKEEKAERRCPVCALRHCNRRKRSADDARCRLVPFLQLMVRLLLLLVSVVLRKKTLNDAPEHTLPRCTDTRKGEEEEARRALSMPPSPEI